MARSLLLCHVRAGIVLLFLLMWRASVARGVSRSPWGLIPSAKIRGQEGLVSLGGGQKGTRRAMSHMKQAYIAVGSNLGDRLHNIARGVKLLCNSSDVNLLRTSFLHESAPMYLTDQPPFFNGVVLVETSLLPDDLLRRLKDVEGELGRNFSQVRNGPRTLDLDIVLYGEDVVVTDNLVIPHPRMDEREFVLGPLCEAGASDVVHPTLQKTVGDLTRRFRKNHPLPSTIRVIPLPRGRCLCFNETLVMGILNVTPDSFSDGGNYQNDVELAAQSALEMERDGASIIDIGGESTRPGAKEVPTEEEMQRTIPVIQRIRERESLIVVLLVWRFSVAHTRARKCRTFPSLLILDTPTLRKPRWRLVLTLSTTFPVDSLTRTCFLLLPNSGCQ